MRRSFTAPTSSKSHIRTPPIREPEIEGAETLFAHPAGKIISFTTSSIATRRHSSLIQERSRPEDEPNGTLSWASATERTIAAGTLVLWLNLFVQLTWAESGPLVVYRVLGSVSFLSSGSTLHPILAKSQCWCVDGESKFVLRIRNEFYYRIELPNTSPADNLKVEEFKIVLAKVLQYERTACPFKRGFTVDLPEPQTPIRKRPWQPRQRSSINESFEINASTEVSNVEEIPNEEDPAGLEGPESDFLEAHIGSYQNSSEHREKIDGESSMDGDSPIFKHPAENESRELTVPETPTRRKSLKTGRAVTVPPLLSLRTSPPSNTITNQSELSKPTTDTSSLSSSGGESFHSFHSPVLSLAPSPPISSPSSTSQAGDHTEISMPRTRVYRRESSESTITSDPIDFWDIRNGGSPKDVYPTSPTPPELISDATSQSGKNSSEAMTPSPSAEVRHRKPPQTRQTHSSLPSQTNLYSPNCRMSGHHLSTAILQKTCSLLLGPPVQLVALMLNIAAKIAKGAYRGVSYGYGENGQRIPCSWDFSDADDEEEEEEQALEQDDYGFSLGKVASSRTERKREGKGDSWEID